MPSFEGSAHMCTSPTGITQVKWPGYAVSPWPEFTATKRVTCDKCGAEVRFGQTKCRACSALPVEQRALPVIGFRAWSANTEWKLGVGWKWRLASTGVDGFWSPGINTAACSSLASTHVAPDPECGCGFYVLASLDEVEEHVGLGGKMIVGAVMGWGRVIQHDDEGWRAQYARVVALLDMKWSKKNDRLANSLAEVYGVPVLNRSVLESYVGEFGDSILKEGPRDA